MNFSFKYKCFISNLLKRIVANFSLEWQMILMILILEFHFDSNLLSFKGDFDKR